MSLIARASALPLITKTHIRHPTYTGTPSDGTGVELSADRMLEIDTCIGANRSIDRHARTCTVDRLPAGRHRGRRDLLWNVASTINLVRRRISRMRWKALPHHDIVLSLVGGDLIIFEFML